MLNTTRLMASVLGLIALGLLLTGCDDPDSIVSPESMDRSEAKFKEEMKERFAWRNSVDAAFTDTRLRELAQAALDDNVKRVEQLVDEGVDLNARGTENVTPLFWAHRNPVTFKRMLELGADPNVIFGDSTVIHEVVQHDDVSLLQLALAHGGNPDLKAGSRQEAPLFNAVKNDHGSAPGMIRALLDAGATVDITTGKNPTDPLSISGITPLILSMMLLRPEAAIELLDRGADPYHKHELGKSAIDALKRSARVLNSTGKKKLQPVLDKLGSMGISVALD